MSYPSTRFVAKHPLFAIMAMLAALSSPASQAADLDPAKVNNDDLYEVMHDGRRYVFDDLVVYRKFLQFGETPYRLTRIGAGPKGETLVFGLKGSDKKKTSGIGSVGLYDGTLPPDDYFYGEIIEDGRIYVFDNLKQMEDMRTLGEPPYRFTEIGIGPGGRTVVFVLRPDNKKKKPTALKRRFVARHM